MRFKMMCIAALMMGVCVEVSFAQEDGASNTDAISSKPSIHFADRDAQPITPPDTSPIQVAMKKIRNLPSV